MRRGLLRLRRPDWASIAAVCRVGLPTAVTGIVFSLIYIVVTRTTTRFGTPALAALGIGHRVESWLFMIGVGFGAATAAIVGQNLGAGHVKRAERAGWLAVGLCSVLGVVACVADLLYAPKLAWLFTNDPAVIARSGALPEDRGDLAARDLRRDRARRRARRCGRNAAADDRVDGVHGVAHPTRSADGESMGQSRGSGG